MRLFPLTVNRSQSHIGALLRPLCLLLALGRGDGGAGRLLGAPVILTEHWGPAGDWLKEPPVPRGLMRSVPLWRMPVARRRDRSGG